MRVKVINIAARGSNFARQICFAAAVIAVAAGCGYFQSGGSDAAAQKERDEKTRQEVAKATENAKPVLQEAGRKIGEAAKTAAEDAEAAAQGVKEGWERSGHSTLDVNSASVGDLETLPGVSGRDARRIVDHRPYSDKHDMVSKGALTQQQYDRIRDIVAAK